MERETHQPLRRYAKAADALLTAIGGEAAADIVYFDDSYAREIAVTQQGEYGEGSGQ